MDEAPAAAAGPAAVPRALSGARAALVLLTALNFLNYVDRYVLAAVLERIKLDPAFRGVTDVQLGALQTSFLYVYMLLSPLSGLAGRRIPRRYLVAAGVGLWSAATVASGLARGYHEMFLARALIGAGEAGYATVAPAMISDLFARDRRNRVLSIFYLATPVGSALGFVVGGLVASLSGWRAAFFVAGGPGLLLSLLSLLLSEPRRGAQDGYDEAHAPARSLADDLRALSRNRAFLRIAAGTTLMTFAVGGLAFWMPTYFQEARGLDVGTANVAFGGLAVVAGIVGTFAGGFLGDAWLRSDPRAYLKLSGLGLLVAAPFALAVPFVPGVAACLACGFLAELFVFLNTGPLNTALIDATPPSIREAAVGLNVLCIHLLGDAVSPPLLGAITGFLEGRGQPHATALGFAVAATSVPLLFGGAVLLFRLPAPPAAGTRAPGPS